MDEQILESYKPVVKALAAFFGKNVEVVLHTLIDGKSSIIAIENGHITGRNISDTLTEAGQFVIKKLEEGRDFFGPYESFSYKRKKLRSITIGIRSKDRRLIGLLCLNMDLTTFEMLENFISFYFSFGENGELALNKSVTLHNDTLEEVFNSIYSVIASKVSKERVDNFTVIKELYENGFFKFKDSVNFVAGKLGISIYTVYSYLRKLEKGVQK